jgi:CTP synthase (UTP-ammonia lyase)
MDLALKIASEKQKSKQEQILNLSKQEIKDKQDLEDKAKDLGIEKGSIEARSSIDNLSADESSLSKLRGRFSVNKESDNQKEDEN